MTAIAHRVIEDDIHDGYYIPKGSLIIPNVWLVLSSCIRHIDQIEFAAGLCLMILGHMPTPRSSTLNASWPRKERSLRPILAQSASGLVDGRP